MAYSSGKYSYGICDKTGFRYATKDLVFEFRNGSKTGLRVGVDVVDPVHPQNFIGRIKFDDPQSIQDARPDRVEPATEVILDKDSLTTGSSGGGTTVITIKEINHGRSSSVTVRLRNVVGFDGISTSVFQNASGYAITKVNNDTYTITVSATATAGNQSGGGQFVTVGPVTLEA